MLSFHLNLQILHDALSSEFSKVTLYTPEQDICCLDTVRMYRPGTDLKPECIYVLDTAVTPLPSQSLCGISFLFSGPVDISRIPPGCPAILVEDSCDFPALFTLIQDVFEKYQTWNQELHNAMSLSHPLDAMLKASVPIFRNPIFIHDTNFYIVSCSHRAPGMLVWDRDPMKNQNIVPLSLINDFKAEPAYLHTLTTTGPDLYPSDQRGYPILYMNLWNQDHYEGRICVDELETPILPGQYPALAHLANLILFSMKNKNLFLLNMSNEAEQLFREYLDGRIQERSRVFKILRIFNWKRKNRYLCLRLETSQRHLQTFSSAATLGHIVTQIPEGYAFTHQNGICVIANLSLSHMQISDILSSLAILLREGLLKMGASTEIQDFLQIPLGYYQAQMALELGLASGSTSWCFRFNDYLLEFLLKKGSEVLPPELLCSYKLLILKEYDQKNNTDLYQTLKTFLHLERNVLQTAKTLFIHRSTLFYRLERIQKIADVNLDDAKERLILRLSFYILEEA